MKKKIILKYILIYLPFILGIVLYGANVFNIFSSLLFFVGGYVALKWTFDYRKISRNQNSFELDNSIVETNVLKEGRGVKRTRKHYRVRKRVRY